MVVAGVCGGAGWCVKVKGTSRESESYSHGEESSDTERGKRKSTAFIGRDEQLLVEWEVTLSWESTQRVWAPLPPPPPRHALPFLDSFLFSLIDFS